MESMHLGIKAISEHRPVKHLGAAQTRIQPGDCDNANEGLAVPPPLSNPRAPVPSSIAVTA